jgi:WD40 repeat protein
MNPNQPRKDDVILGGQTRVPFGAAVLGGLFGFKWRLANGSEEQRLAALSEVLKYKEGYDLLTQQALKDNSEKVQQSAYWVLHGQNPYLSELSGKRSPDEPIVPTDTVSCVAISPDNQTLAGGSWKILRLWRFGTGELLRTLEAHSHWVLSVAISPDGKTLASGSADKTIKLWNLKTGQVLHTLIKHTSWVNVVAISPDGQILISGSADKTIKLWEVNTGKLLRTLKGHSGSVCSLAVSPDGQTLASGSTDKTIKLWDLSTGKLLRTLEEHSNWVQAVAISSDSDTLISSSRDGSIKIWQASSRSENESVVSKPANINLVQISIILISIVLVKFTAGTSLAVPLFMFFSQWMPRNDKKIVPKFPSAALKCIKTLSEHSSSVNSLAIKPDGLGFVSGSDDWTLRLQHLNTKKSLTGHSGFISSVAISPDGKTLVSGSNDWAMLWNLKTGELLHPLQGFSRPRLSRIVVSPSQVRLEFGQTQIFRIRGLDQNGQEMNLGQVVWQATSGKIDTNGLFLADQSEGNLIIKATVGLFKGSALVTVVEPPRLTRLVITPKKVRLEFGQRQTFSVRGLDQRGDEINIGQVSWYATGGSINPNGTFQAGQNSGNFEVIATLGETWGDASVTVAEPARVVSLVISPSQVQLEFGQSQRFSVRGLDQYGNGISIGKVTWSATGGTIKSDGTFQASYEEGNITVTARVGKISGYASVTVVEPPKLITLVVSPQQVQMKPEQRQRFTVRGLDQRGCEFALARVAWKATGGEIDQNGTFIAGHNAKGNFTVTATVGLISGFANVTVLPVLRQLEISPQEVQLKPEERLTFTVRGFDQQGDEIEVWNADWGCTTGGRIDRNGVFIGSYEKREVNVTVTVETLSDSAKVTLLPVLNRLEISPKQVQLEPKENQSFTIKGFDQYGKEIEIGTVNWNTTGGNIYPDGTFVAGDKNANITVSAIGETISDSASVTVVEPPKLTSSVISLQQVEMKHDQTNDDALNLDDEAGLSIISSLDIQDIDTFWNDDYSLDTNYDLDDYSSDVKYVSYCSYIDDYSSGVDCVDYWSYVEYVREHLDQY